MASSLVPTEDQEQAALVSYLQLLNIPYFRVPNETYTTSWKQKAKNKALGVSKGVPDLFVFKDGKVYAIEMKRVKGGVTSPEQKSWIELLNKHGIEAKVCKGADEALAFIGVDKEKP